MKPLIPLIVGNWKLHPLSAESAQKLFVDITKKVQKIQQIDVAVAPSFVHLHPLSKKNVRRVALAAQDVYWEKLGAFTGEVSIPMLHDIGVSYVIVGHSERRAMGETDEMVNQKVIATLKSTLIPIVCIGESARDQQADYLSHIERQIRSASAGVSKSRLKQLVFAYEPIWAIGTGETATPEDVQEIKLFIQKILTDLYGRNSAQQVRILYGGSVQAHNAAELFTEGTVDGFLVGGASLKAQEFGDIIKAVATYGTE